MTTRRAPVHHLELRVRELGQLFNSLDPTPFLNKDLDNEAEAFIETWARAHPPDERLHITVHLAQWPPEGDPTSLVSEAFHNFFHYKAGLVQGDLKQLLKEGRFSLLVGLTFVSVCLVAAQSVAQLLPGHSAPIAREGLTILGWVALWKPLQIFLYEWWPLARRIGVYKNLSRATVRAIQGH